MQLRPCQHHPFSANALESQSIEHGWSDTERLISEKEYDLILVNRLMDQDHTEGMLIIEKLKANDDYKKSPLC
ncbi:MAG: hypothetical protein R3C11_04725 [Planctomycetaceae bacterium]